jgi:hypothetical protein
MLRPARRLHARNAPSARQRKKGVAATHALLILFNLPRAELGAITR